MRAAAIALCILLGGCAQIQTVAESTDTFAACKAADVITTGVALNTGKFIEANKLLAPWIGPHNLVPLVVVSGLMWAALKWLDNPQATMVANAVTCPVAAHNLWLLTPKALQ